MWAPFSSRTLARLDGTLPVLGIRLQIKAAFFLTVVSSWLPTDFLPLSGRNFFPPPVLLQCPLPSPGCNFDFLVDLFSVHRCPKPCNEVRAAGVFFLQNHSPGP